MPTIIVRSLAGTALTALLVLAICALPARALPVFAHRYGFSCQQCHTTVPHLNAFGEYFRKNGFRLPGARGVIPVAIKAELDYTSAGSGDGDDGGKTQGLPKAVVEEIEVLSAGSLGNNAEYWFEQYVVDGGLPGRPRDMWLQFDKPLTSSNELGLALHARVGEFTLPLPEDPETQRPTIQAYGLYQQTVLGNSFTFFEPRVGADLFATDDRNGVQADFVIAQAHDRTSGISSAGVDTMFSLQKTLGDDFTAYAYRYEGQRHLLPDVDSFYRQGVGLGYQGHKLFGSAVLQDGDDTSADGLDMNVRSSGGFLQAGYAFSPAVELVSRYDITADDFDGDSDDRVLSLVLRPRRNMRFTIEGQRTPGGTKQLGLQLMFAY